MTDENVDWLASIWQKVARRVPASVWNLNLALMDQAMISAVNFGTGVLTARYLGATEFGRYVLAFTVMLALNIFQQALVIDPMLSIGSKKPEALASRYFSALLLHQAALSLVLSLLVMGGAALARAAFPILSVEGMELPLVLTIVVGQWQEFMRRQFFARRRMRLVITNDMIRYGTQIAVIVTVVRWHAGSTTGSDILLIMASCAALSLLHAAWYFGPLVWQWPAIRSSIVEHWRFSRWLMPYAALQAINGSIFISAVGYFHGAATAGELRAAQNPLGVMHIAFLGLENIMQVRAARAYGEQGRSALRGVVEKFAAVGGLFTLLVIMSLCLCAHWLLRFLYAGQFVGIEYLFYFYAAGYALAFFAIPMRIAFRAMEVTKPLFISESLQFCIAVVAVYPLTKYLGALGVVIGFVVCDLVIVGYFGMALFRLMRRPAPGVASYVPAPVPAAERAAHAPAKAPNFDLIA